MMTSIELNMIQTAGIGAMANMSAVCYKYRYTVKPFLLCISLLLLSLPAAADDSQPVVEMRADRTIIYPQRMLLTGEETLMDILQMVPELMIGGYEDVLGSYTLRIDNCPVNGDDRLIIRQMKAKDIAMIQVCDNTGVAKGTIGLGRVLDINMKMPDTLTGFVEARGDFGKEVEGIGTVNALYGSKHTDLYANVSYCYQDRSEEFLSLHMTNRFDARKRLLTYFTHQFLELPSGTSRKALGRARYFHTFNDQGTELLLVGSYQYNSNPFLSNKLPLVNAELNTPLFSERLTMMVGVEGDYLMTSQKNTSRSWDVFNHDIYLQLTYSLPQWKFTVGNRVMFYQYKLRDADNSEKHTNTRDNANACVIFVPNSRHQFQLGYYRKYYDPSYLVLFMDSDSRFDETWAMAQGLLQEWTINQFKLAYAYSTQKLTVQTEASHYIMEGEQNFSEFDVAAFWKSRSLMLSGGTNLYLAKSGTFATFRVAPTAYLPHHWQIGLQLVYYTDKSPIRELFGTSVYGSLSVHKQFGKRWHLGVDWHDMFDSVCRDVTLNRHAANVKVQYRF